MALRSAGRYQPRHRAVKVRDERSNSFAMMIALMPLILGVFGVGLDVTRNVYIRASIQNSLDLATVAGAAEIEVGSDGSVKIDRDKAMNTVKHVYAINRSSGPLLDCVASPWPIKDSTQVQCWREPSSGWGHLGSTDLSYRVRETSRNAFLQMLGIPKQRYLVESHAALKFDTE